jgi:hypothetical protein
MTKVKSDTLLEWKRAKKDETEISHRRRWFSRCGHYEVNESTSKYELKDNGKPLVVYYAIHNQRLISRHRMKHKAEESCEKRARKVLGLPELRKKRRSPRRK